DLAADRLPPATVQQEHLPVFERFRVLLRVEVHTTEIDVLARSYLEIGRALGAASLPETLERVDHLLATMASNRAWALYLGRTVVAPDGQHRWLTARARLLPTPFDSVAGWVVMEGLEFLRRLDGRACEWCRKPAPEDATARWRFCGPSCRQRHHQAG